MTTIATARGAIEPLQLGVTMMHEHVFILSPEINKNYPESWGDEDKQVESAIARLQAAKNAGVDTIVDLTALGLGRSVTRIERLALAVELNIVLCSGLYTWDVLPMYFRLRTERMADMFVRDIEEGIGGTELRAAILKCATHEPGITEGVALVLKAVAEAHRRTGAPITTHTHDAPNGLEQQRVLKDEGVDLSRVVIGHVDRASRDEAYIHQILEAGSYIGFDQFGKAGVPVTLDERVIRIAELCRDGYARHIVLSQDSYCHCDMLPTPDSPSASPYTFVTDEVVPRLRAHGVAQEHLQAMLVDNPRAILGSIALGSY